MQFQCETHVFRHLLPRFLQPVNAAVGKGRANLQHPIVVVKNFVNISHGCPLLNSRHSRGHARATNDFRHHQLRDLIESLCHEQDMRRPRCFVRLHPRLTQKLSVCGVNKWKTSFYKKKETKNCYIYYSLAGDSNENLMIQISHLLGYLQSWQCFDAFLASRLI